MSAYEASDALRHFPNLLYIKFAALCYKTKCVHLLDKPICFFLIFSSLFFTMLYVTENVGS